VLKAQLQSSGSYSSPSVILGSITLDTPSSIVVDGSGNIFITDAFTRTTVIHNRILMSTPLAGGGYTTNTIATTGAGTQPWGLAVDVNGNVYYSDITKNQVVKLASGTWTPSTVASGLFGPYGLAVDAAGDVYIADTNNSTSNQVLIASPNGSGTYSVAVIANSGFGNLRGVGIDPQGNLYVADQIKNQVGDLTDVGKISLCQLPGHQPWPSPIRLSEPAARRRTSRS
jgi:sugar lactone lactonase YvrE